MRTFLVMSFVCLTVTLTGCGGGREKERNKDFDRPAQPTTTK
ncbi:MAG: hypothetical protein ACRCZF_22990 [Gemmataceae bacterium]